MRFGQYSADTKDHQAAGSKLNRRLFVSFANALYAIKAALHPR
jgi:hypothetical protein